jgi:protein O-mannosyl-transferase
LPTLIVSAALLAAVLAAYSNAYQSGWVLDNRPIVHDDPRLASVSWANLTLIATQDYWYPRFASGLYRPLTTLSYLANAAFPGGHEETGGYHVVNHLLHALNALLLFLLCRRLTGRVLPALGAGLIFALHPIATEAVTNIIGRADLLAASAVLAGTLVYIELVDGRHSARARRAWLCALFLITVAGLLCKESAVALLGLAGLYDITRRGSNVAATPAGVVRRIRGWFARGYCVFVPAVIIVAALRYAVLGGTVANEPFVDNPLRGAEFFSARLTAIEILGRQLWHLVWPDRLSSDYAFNQIPTVSLPPLSAGALGALLSIAAVAAAIVIAFRSRRTQPPLFFFILFIFVAYLPVSNLLVLIGSNMADRFMYLPLAGFAATAALAIEAVSRRFASRRTTAVATAVVLTACAALGIRTWQRNLAWIDGLSLARAAEAVSPNSFSAHGQLAVAMFEADPTQLDAVIAEAEKGIAILDPLPPGRSVADPYVRLATYYAGQGDRLSAPSAAGVAGEQGRPSFDRARNALERARTIDQALNQRHRELERQAGKVDDAIPDTGLPMVYELRSIVDQRLGDDGPALESAEYARHLMPLSAPAYLRVGLLTLRLNRAHDGKIAYLQAALLDGSSVDAWRVLDQISRDARPGACPIVVFANQQPRLNADCAEAGADTTEAFAGIIEVLINAHQVEQAHDVKRYAIRQYHVPAAVLDRLLPN